MTKLTWNQGSAVYETGIDRGVLYPSNGPGVVWNGLINVEESMIGGENTSFQFDGIKYLDVVSPRNYQATISAFSAPEEFSNCVGEKSVIPGFVLTRQPRTRFGFSYRTLMGTDLGYKIHIVYNATATQISKSHQTLSDSQSIDTRSWKIDAVPPAHSQYRPSAHFTIDSMKIDPGALSTIETFLYGTDTIIPALPSIEEMLDLLVWWYPLYITPQDITGLSQLSPGMGDLYKTRVDGINRALPTTRLRPSLISGLYRME